MITLSGKSVFGGVAIGKIAFYKRQEKQVRRYHLEDTEAEVARFEESQETAIAQLGELYDKAMEDVGEANAAIFEVHQMMLMDLDYVDSIKNIITTQEVNAEYAVATTGDNFSRMFASMELLHARLVRTTTCVDGCRCDYTICGDKDPYLKEHPEYRDEAGFRRNK